MKRALLLGCAAITFVGCMPKGTTVYVVRHAEKSDDDPKDPSLSAEGLKRADALVTAVPAARLSAVYTTEYLRTQQTVFPVAEKAGLVPEVYKAADTPKLLDLVKRNHTNETIIVCGHSNTVGQIIAGLGVKERVELEDTDYGDLYVVRIVEGIATLERKRFGP